MGIGSTTVGRGLQVSSDVRALTFTELDGAMSEVFRDQNKFFNPSFMRLRQLAPGASSERFGIYGGAVEDAEHHTAGQFIEGGTTTQSYVDVSVDDPIIKAQRLPFQDVSLSKWDLVKPTASDNVRIISEKIDKRICRVWLNAARTAAVSGVHNGGLRVIRGSVSGATVANAYPVSSTGADNLAADFAEMGRKADEANWPEENRIAAISPWLRQVLTRSNRIMNYDYAKMNDVSIASRAIGMVEGWHLVVTQHIPQPIGGTVAGYAAQPASELTKYKVMDTAGGTGSTTMDGGAASRATPAALFMYNGNDRGPVGAVMAAGMENIIWKDENFHAWFVKSSIMIGLGVAECFCAGELGITSV